ncbi:MULTISPECIES: ATP-binding protein [Lysinibacillus]|uniref:histidine kinase n=1 Tax=Lysinibacillus capsici TaxID=2115968 RepID=A0A2X0XD37_9BACI|nr:MULTISPECIES: ATP-binding protein [Lysinibacillus]KMN39174.1 histidine kinase [Lysinibacillus sp. LK3]MCS5501003.1 ATP-binding protein [Lysinibacillus sp. A4]MCT1538171.1 ATP-binding protein [Lysinibacillus capsici]MCT1570049.1 ATP-binding protein [Lysinibacillus capsici]MCT1646833.1 ATP-binding protein [Lysinibacillus capsici]
MKSMSNRLFLTFMLLLGTILAVLMIVIGQLFPVYIEQYNEQATTEIRTSMDQVIDERKMDLTKEDQEALYAAQAMERDESLLNYVRARLYGVLAILFTITLILIAIISRYMIRNFTAPIDNVTDTALELAKGNYRARAQENEHERMIPLSHSINILARNLQDITTIREVEEERLKTLIENMGSSLMMIGREGNISIVNRVFLERFGMQLDDVQGKVFRTIGLPKSLEQFIDHVFLTEMPYRQQIKMEVQQELYNKEVYGAPVIGDHGRWLGVVIVMHDITELVRLEQIRKDFVANVSHELRTPITSIKGFSETLLDGAYKDEKMLISFLEIIYKESNRLQMLIQDLLELSKIEQHGFTVNIMPMGLQDVLIRGAELTAPRLDEKNMSFQVDIERDVQVMGDANRIIQIVTNLITNAITYSPENTTVSIRLKENETHGIIEIEDQGIGIEKHEIARVFERFYRVDRARSRNSGGTGLGLAIVKHLVEAHHGRIQVESEVGIGTKMIVMIPKN